MSDPVRLGVIGVGDVAQRDYLPEIGRLEPAAVVVAVAGASAGRVRDIAQRIGVTAHVGYASLLADDDVDAVLNLTPGQLHEEINTAALAAGKHVYSEKPLAMTAAAARSLGETAAADGLVLTAAPSVLVYPQIEMVQAQLATGSLGSAIVCSSAMFGGVPPWEGFVSDPTHYFAEGIGPLVDIGVYPLHALTGLLGPVRTVSATGRRTRDAFEMSDGPFKGQRIPVEEDDLSILTLTFTNGVLGTIQSSFASVAGAEPELEILCDRGGAACALFDPTAPVRVSDGSDWQELTVSAERSDGPDHVLGVRHLVRCIKGQARPILTAHHAAHVLDVIEAARRSTAAQAFVDVPDRGWLPAEGVNT
jgi:predicted dehydrogenase